MYRTSDAYDQRAPEFMSRYTPNEEVDAALAFAELMGVKVKEYYHDDMSQIKIIYQPEKEKAASYFIE